MFQGTQWKLSFTFYHFISLVLLEQDETTGSEVITESPQNYTVNKTWMKTKTKIKTAGNCSSIITALLTFRNKLWGKAVLKAQAGSRLTMRLSVYFWDLEVILFCSGHFHLPRGAVILTQKIPGNKPVWKSVLKPCYKLTYPANVAFISSCHHRSEEDRKWKL